MRYPFFNEVVKTREATITATGRFGSNRLMVNRNRLLFRWNESDGVKTGYTKQAGRCLIASATRWMRTPSGKTQLSSHQCGTACPDTFADSRFILQKSGCRISRRLQWQRPVKILVPFPSPAVPLKPMR
jgi:D-alanyl-D-alanine carboxypeptidase (penicillin-binding protein 5/6)